MVFMFAPSLTVGVLLLSLSNRICLDRDIQLPTAVELTECQMVYALDSVKDASA